MLPHGYRRLRDEQQHFRPSRHGTAPTGLSRAARCDTITAIRRPARTERLRAWCRTRTSSYGRERPAVTPQCFFSTRRIMTAEDIFRLMGDAPARSNAAALQSFLECLHSFKPRKYASRWGHADIMGPHGALASPLRRVGATAAAARAAHNTIARKADVFYRARRELMV